MSPAVLAGAQAVAAPGVCRRNAEADPGLLSAHICSSCMKSHNAVGNGYLTNKAVPAVSFKESGTAHLHNGYADRYARLTDNSFNILVQA